MSRKHSRLHPLQRQLLIQKAIDRCPVNFDPMIDWWKELAPLTNQERIAARQAVHDNKIQQHRSIIGSTRC